MNSPEEIIDGKFYRRAIAEMYHFRHGLKVSNEVHAVVVEAGKVFYHSYYSSRHYDNRPRQPTFQLLAALGALLTELMGGALGALIYPAQEVLAAHESHISVNIFHHIMLLIGALVIGVCKAFWLAIFRPGKGVYLFFSYLFAFDACDPESIQHRDNKHRPRPAASVQDVPGPLRLEILRVYPVAKVRNLLRSRPKNVPFVLCCSTRRQWF